MKKNGRLTPNWREGWFFLNELNLADSQSLAPRFHSSLLCLFRTSVVNIISGYELWYPDEIEGRRLALHACFCPEVQFGAPHSKSSSRPLFTTVCVQLGRQVLRTSSLALLYNQRPGLGLGQPGPWALVTILDSLKDDLSIISVWLFVLCFCRGAHCSVVKELYVVFLALRGRRCYSPLITLSSWLITSLRSEGAADLLSCGAKKMPKRCSLLSRWRSLTTFFRHFLFSVNELLLLVWEAHAKRC